MRRRGYTFIAYGGDDREYARQFDELLTAVDSLIEEYRDANEKLKWPELLLRAGLGKVRSKGVENSIDLLNVLPSVDYFTNTIDADMPGGGGSFRFYYCPTKERQSLIKGLKQLIGLLRGSPRYDVISERAAQFRVEWNASQISIREQNAREEKRRQEEDRIALAGLARRRAETQVRELLSSRGDSELKISDLRRLEPPCDVDIAAQLLARLVLGKPSYVAREPGSVFAYLVPGLLKWLSKYHDLEVILRAASDKEPQCLALMIDGATDAIRELGKQAGPQADNAYGRGAFNATRDAIAFYGDLIGKIRSSDGDRELRARSSE